MKAVNKKAVVILLVVTLVTMICASSSVFAENGDSIPETTKKPGAAEKVLSAILNGLTDFFYGILQKVGLDLDTIVFNKSPGDSNGNEKVSIFMLDFSKNSTSPFARMAFPLYELMKSFALMLMFTILLGLGGKLQFSATTKNKVQISEVFSNYIISMLLIFAMPWVMDIFMWLANRFIDAIRPEGGFLEVVRGKDDLGSAIVYLGTVLLSLYFAFLYAARAMHVFMFFFMFPVMSMYLNSAKFREKFNEYVSDLISTVLIQPFDGLLFTGLSLVFASQDFFIKLLLASAVIPTRGLIKRYLGFTKGSMASDMLGFAAVTSAIGLAKGMVGGTKDFMGGIKGGVSDINNARRGLCMSTNNSYSPGASEPVYAGAADYAGMSSTVNMGSSLPFESTQAYSPQNMWMTKGGIDIDKFGKVMPQTPVQAAKQLEMRGRGKIASSFIKGAAGLGGSFLGAAAGSAFGIKGALVGAQLGSILGSGVGGAVGGGVENYLNTISVPGINQMKYRSADHSIHPMLDEASLPQILLPEADMNFYGLGLEGEIKNEPLRNGLGIISSYPEMSYKDKDAVIKCQLNKLGVEGKENYARNLNKTVDSKAMQVAIRHDLNEAGTQLVRDKIYNHAIGIDTLSSLSDDMKIMFSDNMEKKAIEAVMEGTLKRLNEMHIAEMDDIIKRFKRTSSGGSVNINDLV